MAKPNKPNKPNSNANVKGGQKNGKGGGKKGQKHRQEEDAEVLEEEQDDGVVWQSALAVLTERGKFALLDRCIPTHPVALFSLNVSLVCWIGELGAELESDAEFHHVVVGSVFMLGARDRQESHLGAENDAGGAGRLYDGECYAERD